ncbi:hypothetical protein SS37A_42230 (plasmid) [Methylocystis iwaonis]|uniref:Transposase n=1 Tax=Methylocystis iwaonis TaxID=2885079 RepID=A0ABM8EF61_9HYPH|nr:hypothetical protein SS37A_42230 [Methylocystis iwaonis]
MGLNARETALIFGSVAEKLKRRAKDHSKGAHLCAQFEKRLRQFWRPHRASIQVGTIDGFNARMNC